MLIFFTCRRKSGGGGASLQPLLSRLFSNNIFFTQFNQVTCFKQMDD